MAPSTRSARPIYTRSAGRWRGYEHDLGPLIEGLGKAAKIGDDGTELPSP